MKPENVYSGIFLDKDFVTKIQKKIPQLFLIAEADNSRNGKLGMEIGSARERILIAMLMYKYGEDAVNHNLPITEPEVDVIVGGYPLSIKTASGPKPGSVKLIWTVDAKKASDFVNSYEPACDMMLAHLNWGSTGHLYVFSKDSQSRVLRQLGKAVYMKLPKAGTNPRGVELSSKAIDALVNDPDTQMIEILYIRENLTVDPYKRWLDHWNSEL